MLPRERFNERRREERPAMTIWREGEWWGEKEQEQRGHEKRKNKRGVREGREGGGGKQPPS